MPGRVRAGEPLRRATLSQSLYPELSIRSFSKLDQTDRIGRWDGAESECVGRPKLGVQESDEKNEENHNLRFSGISRRLCVSVSPGWIGSRRPMSVSRRRCRGWCDIRSWWLLRLPDRNQRKPPALRGRWFRFGRRARIARRQRELQFWRQRDCRCELHLALPRWCDITGTNPPGLWREYMVVMNSTNFCKDHMDPNGFTSDPVLATEGVPPDERPTEAPEIPGRPIPAPRPPAPALQVTPGIPGALTPGIPNP